MTAAPIRGTMRGAMWYPHELDEPFYRGCAAILLVIAATLTVVGVLMAACGCGLWCVAIGLPVLLPAAACAALARLMRAAR